MDNELRIRLSDAFISLEAGSDINIQASRRSASAGTATTPTPISIRGGFYSADAGVSLFADGSSRSKTPATTSSPRNDHATDLTASAVYPGTFEATALTGDLTLNTGAQNGPPPSCSTQARPASCSLPPAAISSR